MIKIWLSRYIQYKVLAILDIFCTKHSDGRNPACDAFQGMEGHKSPSDSLLHLLFNTFMSDLNIERKRK